MGSQPSVPFVKLKVVMSVPSDSVGVVSRVDQGALDARLSSPDCSVVPYSYIPFDSPPSVFCHANGTMSDLPSEPGKSLVSIVYYKILLHLS